MTKDNVVAIHELFKEIVVPPFIVSISFNLSSSILNQFDQH